MDPQNPYAPPVDTSDAPPLVPETPGMALSEEGWATVTSMAKWMRIVSTFFFIFGALLAVFSLIAIVSGGSILGRARPSGLTGGLFAGWMLFMLFVTVMLFFAGAWLRQAAYHFYDGVLSNAEHALGLGFRKLRLYMILYGVYGILQLINSVVQMFVKGGA